jgi:hypothetical protein
MNTSTREAIEAAGFVIGDRVSIGNQTGTVVGFYQDGGTWWIGVSHNGPDLSEFLCDEANQMGASDGYHPGSLTLVPPPLICPRCEGSPVLQSDYLCEECRFGYVISN